MKSFNVIIEDNGKFKAYDIMPYLLRTYKEKYKGTILDGSSIKEFIDKESMYQWWSRCEYEIILSDWPCQKKSEKWDIYKQIQMNIDIIADVFKENLKDE